MGATRRKSQRGGVRPRCIIYYCRARGARAEEERMSRKVSRREFVRSDVATGAALAASPVVITQKTVKLVVISDTSGIRFKSKGPMSGIEKAFELVTNGEKGARCGDRRGQHRRERPGGTGCGLRWASQRGRRRIDRHRFCLRQHVCTRMQAVRAAVAGMLPFVERPPVVLSVHRRSFQLSACCRSGKARSSSDDVPDTERRRKRRSAVWQIVVVRHS